MKTIKEISETLNEAPRDVWGKQYKKLQGEFKTLAKHLNAKIKDIDKRWKTMSDSERSNTVMQMVSIRRKLTDAWNVQAPTKGMYQKRAGD
tara:strand:- start:299 stop:571 length:273 start_codon:yes stop_codon:yes gene_type:complete